MSSEIISRRKGLLALSPIAVFLFLYLAVSLIIGDFYKMPLSIAFIVAAMWALFTTPTANLSKRIEIFSKGAAKSDILYMVWIFILAGAFSALAKGTGSIDVTVDLVLSIIPSELIIPGLFIAACFISLSIGTSVGTVVALTPFACELATTTGGDIAFLVAVVLGGSFFGDNLSFISDTTIAATRSQNCKMSDKFKTNLWIAIPAAITALFAYSFSGNSGIGEYHHLANTSTSAMLILPYIIVIITAAFGLNVLVVLTLGIISAVTISFFYTDISLINMCGLLGEGIDSMGNLIVVTLLAAGLLELIKFNGGIQFIIQWLTRHISGKKGSQFSIALLVSIVNLCTANNTIAIITVGEIAKNISIRFNLDPRKVASILDTCSCIVQCIIPYGAQTLLAAGIAKVAPISFLPYLYYAWLLLIMVVVSILFNFPKKYTKENTLTKE